MIGLQIRTTQIDGGVTVNCLNPTANSLMYFNVNCVPKSMKGSELFSIHGFYEVRKNQIRFYLGSTNEYGNYIPFSVINNISTLQQEQLNLIKQCIETCFNKIKELNININTDAHLKMLPAALK